MRTDRGSSSASRTPGPAAVRFTEAADGIEVEARGPGAAWMLEHAPDWCGAGDDDTGFDPAGAGPRPLAPQPRSSDPRTGLITERLIPVILEQKVTGNEARRAYRRLSGRSPSPRPAGSDSRCRPTRFGSPSFPTTRSTRSASSAAARRCSERCARAAGGSMRPSTSPDAAEARLSTLHGIGAWTVAEVARIALGDADAVSVGDYHVPNIVAWALAREPRGSDERMLELLEPLPAPRPGAAAPGVEWDPRAGVRSEDGASRDRSDLGRVSAKAWVRCRRRPRGARR